jgi:helix-turn-helix protein
VSNDGVNGKEPGSSELPLPSDSSGATIIAASNDTKIDASPSTSALRLDSTTIFTGAVLRQIRESQRITLREVSERTKISVASLSALEEERYDDLPNARVYVRGFVRCLAAEIGLDKDQVSRTYVPRWEAWFYDRQHA